MEVTKNEQSKIISIWMTHADQQDPACQQQAKELIRAWHAKGWLPVIFRSGTENLEELTSALLVSNRNRMARREVEQQRKAQEKERPSFYETLQSQKVNRTAPAQMTKRKREACR